jgi:hypothetical protein
MWPSKSLRILAVGLVSALLMTPSWVAHAEGVCSQDALKDFFLQGGAQVLQDARLKITSLSQDKLVAQSDSGLTCRYLMELSDQSKRWVRFTYSLDETGAAALDYEEET